MKKNVLITGGASGIGASCIKIFNNKGYNVISLDINKINDNVDSYICDISNEYEVKKCICKIKEKYKNIDVLINNAGIQISESFNNYSYRKHKKVMDINYFGTCNVIHSVIDLMHEKSTILNILSVHSKIPRMNKYVYDSSKSALEMLTKELALELAPKKITINALSFGAVDTNMNLCWKNNPKEKDIAKSKVPLGIIFTSDEIAKFCYNIINDFSLYTTGSIFVVDGGRSLI